MEKALHIPGDDPSKQECQPASNLIQVHKNKIPTFFFKCWENSPKLYLEDYACATGQHFGNRGGARCTDTEPLESCGD